MQKDFHYYATYCAAYLAGFSHEESLEIAHSAQMVDDCTVTFLKKIGGPISAATSQLQLEMMDIKVDPITLQDITRIWSSFHFLPYDLKGTPSRKVSRRYLEKYRLICKPNGELLADTVNLAKGKGTQATGIAMHVLADTWAHSYFAGTPSLVINNTNFQFYEVTPEGDKTITFVHKLGSPDDFENRKYTCSIYQENENSIMNLGHGRAGHLPDYSFIKYKYLPAWGDYEEIVKDNPAEYMKAFGQMVYAMKYLRGDIDTFERENYADEVIAPYRDEIDTIIRKKQLIACDDWKAFGEKLSGKAVDDYDLKKYENEYMYADRSDKNDTFVGKFILSAMAQKSMVTNRIYKSGNKLAGKSVDYNQNGLKGIKDYFELITYMRRDEP